MMFANLKLHKIRYYIFFIISNLTLLCKGELINWYVLVVSTLPMGEDLLIVITIAPTIANNKINEVITNKINKFVYKILPILVI
jgi:hypothetical protein